MSTFGRAHKYPSLLKEVSLGNLIGASPESLCTWVCVGGKDGRLSNRLCRPLSTPVCVYHVGVSKDQREPTLSLRQIIQPSFVTTRRLPLPCIMFWLDFDLGLGEWKHEFEGDSYRGSWGNVADGAQNGPALLARLLVRAWEPFSSQVVINS